MATAVFPGSFDPPTYGHLNIIERACRLFDKVDVLVSVNSQKNYMFSDQERKELLEKITSELPNVEVHIWDSLVVEYCRKIGARVLVRGVRNSSDFSHEFDLSLMNRFLCQNVETLFIPTDQKFFLVSSSAIKEAFRFGGNISTMVPPEVEAALREKTSLQK